MSVSSSQRYCYINVTLLYC